MKVKCDLQEVFDITKKKLFSEGLLLSSIGRKNQANVMTIGWGLIGRLWRDPVFMVAVRPSRYTFTLLEETNEFTVNVPPDDLENTVAYCGQVSGRDHDKIAERELTILNGTQVKSPIIQECIAHFECEVIGKSKVTPDLLSSKVQQDCYPLGDYHTLYYGKIQNILKEK